MNVNNHLSPEIFIDFLWEQKCSGQLEFPLLKPSKQEAVDSFAQLCDLDPMLLIKEGEWGSRYEYKYPKLPFYLDFRKTGLESSNHFFFENRMSCGSMNSPSPFHVWNDKKHFSSLVSALYSLKLDEVNRRSLVKCFYLRKHVASQFRPSAAKAIYTMFNSKNTLDFSSGWGDRVTGFLATSSGQSYVGVDPNKELYDSYVSLIETFNTAQKTVLIKNIEAESISSYGKTFDTVFTSPPYFNIEKYSNQETQSHKKYKNFDKWLEFFLYRVIAVAWGHLQKNAILAINISDVYSGKKIRNICDPMNDFISTLPNSSYLGCMGYRLPQKPTKAVRKHSVFCEPIWLWSNDTSNFFEKTGI